MPSTPFSSILFDFDGTLSRSTIDFARLRRKITALAEPFLGEEPEPSPLPVLEWIEELAAEIREFDDDLAKQFHTRGRLIVQAHELDAAREAALFPFTRPMLAGLRESGVKTGVLTRNSTAAVRVIFPDIAACCDAFMAREDAPHVKPHPDHALTLLARLDADPARALLVGDHPIDVETARRAGLASGAVTSGQADREELAAAGPDFLAADCAALVNDLRANGALPSNGNRHT